MKNRNKTNLSYEYFGLETAMGPEEYTKVLQKLVSYYDRRSAFYKYLYLILSILRLALLGAIPVLALSDYSLLNPYMLTGMSSGALFADGILSVISAKDKWKSYRKTCDRLCMEHRMYATGAGSYQNPETSFREFVCRCEDIIRQEGDTWESLLEDSPKKTSGT